MALRVSPNRDKGRKPTTNPEPTADFNRPIDVARLRALLAAGVIGRRIMALGEIPSTNDTALETLNREHDAQHPRAADGLVVIAEHQTAGRGRRGAVWWGARSRDLLFSVVLHLPGAPVAALTALAAVAVTDAAPGLGIKWPNDLYAGTKKCGGILVERSAAGGAVLGVGLNVNSRPGDLPPGSRAGAVSLSQVRGAPVDRTALLAAVLGALDHRSHSLRAGRLDDLENAWRARLVGRGQAVRIQHGARTIHGVLLDADFTGAITLRVDDEKTLVLPGEQVRELRFPQWEQ